MFTAELSACGGNDATTSFLAFCFFNLMNVEPSRDKNSVCKGALGVRMLPSLAGEYLKCLIAVQSMNMCTSYFADW